jgi:hypothetical protein
LLFRRHRLRQQFAGVPEVDTFEDAPIEPPVARAPAPETVRLAPSPPPVERAPAGLVSTRLRPWIEISFNPLRCVLDNERVTIDFELELVNSGNAAARDVLVDATAFNAGPAQDGMINGFFATPREGGQRVETLPPLQRIVVPLQLMIPRDQLQPYELGGKQVFVPVVALNAIYRWATNDGQTSASYLLGRGTEGEKLAPFRLDAGPRIFRGTAARLLAPSVRR